MSVVVPIQAPRWMADAINSVNRELLDDTLLEYLLPELPPASEHRGDYVMVLDIKMVAFSNGSTWKRIDTGAVIG